MSDYSEVIEWANDIVKKSRAAKKGKLRAASKGKPSPVCQDDPYSYDFWKDDWAFREQMRDYEDEAAREPYEKERW
jgi:hypothetical protein